METDDRIKAAVMNTEVVRPPKQSLATFGTTNVYYYLVAEAAYNEINNTNETVIREGRVIAERPRIVTPSYLSRVQGFSAEARKLFEMLMTMQTSSSAGLMYSYRNEPREVNIVSDDLPAVIARLNGEIDRQQNPLTSIIKGEDMLWDVSILKFIYEITQNSVADNFSQLNMRGLFNMDSSGLPSEARIRIEALFDMVSNGEMEPAGLKNELERWNVFGEYQDRFFDIFKKKL
jgi:hypothetical protein